MRLIFAFPLLFVSAGATAVPLLPSLDQSTLTVRDDCLQVIRGFEEMDATLEGYNIMRIVAAYGREEDQQAMAEGPATWRAVVGQALALLDGEATLAQIYDFVAERRPTENPHWRQQVRKVCQQTARRTGRGRYALPEQADLFAA